MVTCHFIPHCRMKASLTVLIVFFIVQIEPDSDSIQYHQSDIRTSAAHSQAIFGLPRVFNFLESVIYGRFFAIHTLRRLLVGDQATPHGILMFFCDLLVFVR